MLTRRLQLGKKRKALEAMFEERTAELRVLTDNSAVGIFRTTIDGRISYANAAWYDLSGYPAGREVINWGDYAMESDQARVRQVWEGFVTDPNAGELTTEWQWANGRWGQWRVSVARTWLTCDSFHDIEPAVWPERQCELQWVLCLTPS